MIKRNGILIFVTCMLVISLHSCSKKKSDQTDTQQNPAVSDSTIVALVNNSPIHENDVLSIARRFLQQTGMEQKLEPTDSSFQAQALDWLITKKLLREEVQRYDIEIGAEEVDAAWGGFQNQFKSKAEFNTFLMNSALTQEQLKRNIELDLKIQKMLDIEIAKRTSDVSRDEVRKFYLENSDQFVEREQVKARHILIKVGENASEMEIKAAKQKAQTLYKRIKAGEDFETLAKENSDCPSAANGGDLGYFSRGDMVEAFENEVFSLKPGQVSEPVRTEFGFHTIKLDEYIKAGKKPFESVEADVTEFLKQKNAAARFEKYIDNLKSKADIKIIREL
ncbi:peptidylprolyl isomerase [candidate division KSB1 bacterium]|nr:peptidylprolyl isomerase [candidate division KSB1 bacterium]